MQLHTEAPFAWFQKAGFVHHQHSGRVIQVFYKLVPELITDLVGVPSAVEHHACNPSKDASPA